MWNELNYAFRRGMRTGFCQIALVLVWLARSTTQTHVGYAEYTDIIELLKEKMR